MPIPGLLPADGDPPDDPSAAETAHAQRETVADTDTQRTEYPLPESFPSGGPAGQDA